VEGGRELADRILRSGTRIVFAASMAAGVVVFAYFETTSVIVNKYPWWTDYVEFVGLAVVLFPLGRALAIRQMRDAIGWLREDRVPNAHEREATLAVPAKVARVTFGGWVFVGIFVGLAVSAAHPASQAVRTGLGTIFAGAAVALLSALLVERLMRPAVARALAGQPPDRERVVGIRRRLLLFWVMGSGVPLVGIALTPLGLPASDKERIIIAAVALAGIGLFSGLLFTVVAAASIADPMSDVRKAMARVAEGDLEAEVPVDDDGEIGQLQAGFNHMATGLRDRERLREVFGGYVGQDVARQALDAGVSLEGEQREVSVLFVDVIGSTAFAEGASPADVVRLLNAFFEVVIGAVDAEQGWVNKFEGDAALCVFGAPVPQGDHAARALRAATAVRAGLSMLPGLDAGIGVSSGPVVAGNIGSERRYEYTVVGDPVNEAARLTELAKSHAGRIVVSERTVAAAGTACDGWRPGECVTLRGRSRPTQTFVPA
jgi:adenylate cyclase